MRRKLRLEVASSVQVALIPTTLPGQLNRFFFKQNIRFLLIVVPANLNSVNAERLHAAHATLVPTALARSSNVLPVHPEGESGGGGLFLINLIGTDYLEP